MRDIMSIARDRELVARLTDQAIRAEVASHAQCADGTVDPDEWFPISADTEAARRAAERGGPELAKRLMERFNRINSS